MNEFTVQKAHDPSQAFLVSEDVNKPSLETHPLENEVTRARFDKVRNWFQQAQSNQYENRAKMARAERFYDNEQWTKEDEQELEERGQAPLVYNKIKPTINWILGTERKSRVEAKVLARNKNKTVSAEAKTKLLKYIDDVNMTAYHRSHAFSDACIAGVGWLETGVRDDHDEPLYVQHESWRNIWYDDLSQAIDMKDARFIFRSKWVDLDIAQMMFPDRATELEHEAQNVNRVYPMGTEGDGDVGVGTYDEITGRSTYSGMGNYIEDMVSTTCRRLRVRLIEAWYRETASCQSCHAPNTPLHGSVRSEADAHQTFALDQGTATLVDAIRPLVRVMIYCGGTVVYDQPSPYRHNRFPFVPIWCYRRGKNNSPYGIVEGIIDPQIDLNKRKSKALHILSSNKFIADDNACNDWEEFRREAARPDGIIRKTPNSAVLPINESQIAREQLDLAKDDERFIQDVSGVTNENLGKDSNIESGVGIRAKQTQGLVATSIAFDNLNMAVQICGEIEVALIEQFYDTPKVVRLLNDKNAASYMEINGEGDNITDDKADFIVTQQDLRDTIRQGMFEMMSEFTTRLDPQTALNMLDLVVDMSDVPGREGLVARIRKMNGQTDPDAAITPEQQQADEEKDAMNEAKKQEIEDLTKKGIELDLKLKEAEITVNAAKLEKLQAEAVVKSVEALYASMQAAQTAATVPGVVPIADEIAKSAGFVDKNNAPIYKEPIVDPQTIQQAPPMEQQPAQPMNTSPMFPPSMPSAGQGMEQGIETPNPNDGIIS
jgi:hypothetical protein